MKKLIFSLVAILVGFGAFSTAEARTRHKTHHYRKVMVIDPHSTKSPQIYNSETNVASFFINDNVNNVAQTKKNVQHISHNIEQNVVQTVSEGRNWVAKASQYVGLNARQLGLPSRLWCADFMNKITHSGNDRTAKSYLHRGRPAPYGCVNCIAVTGRRGGGHTGVVMGYKNGNPILISGNHGRKVGIGAYARSRVLGYRYI